MQELTIETRERNQFIDITGKVSKALKKEKIKEGLCFLFVPHTSAGITINENDCPYVKTDIIKALARIVPFRAGYEHQCDRENADSHVKQSLVGCQTIVPLKKGEMVLGDWQGIIFCEFDGPRTRKLFVQAMGK